MAALSKVQERELRKIITQKPRVPAGLQRSESFVLRYIAFESQARLVWHYYRCRSREKPKSNAGIPLTELVKAVNYFGLNFEKSKLETLLDSKLNKRKTKSARNLRNDIAHSWRKEDCDEVTDRFDEFAALFDEFEQALRRKS